MNKLQQMKLKPCLKAIHTTWKHIRPILQLPTST